MNLSIYVPNCKPVSVNRAYYKRARTLTKEARTFRMKFLHELRAHASQFKEFREAFDPNIHSLGLDVSIEIPESIFFTNKGPISNLSGDLDNYLKLIIDFLTNKKYDCDKYLDRGSNLAIDDRFFTYICASKVPVDRKEWGIMIELQLITLKD